MTLKALFWIGGIAIVVLVLVFGGMRLFSDLTARGDSAAAFANTVATATTTTWEPASLEPFADETFYKSLAADPGQWGNYALLGPAVDAPKCQVTNLKIVNGLANALASCPTKFQKGSGTLLVSVSDYSGEWRVTGFKLQL